MWSWIVYCLYEVHSCVLYSAWSGVSSVHVVLSVLRSREGCMLAFAMFMSMCSAVIVMSSAYVVSCTESAGSGMSEV